MTLQLEPAPAPKMRDTTIPLPRFIDARNDRAEHDWYVDSPDAIAALLAAERFSGLSWDPACGLGTIPKAMDAAGLCAIGSDLVDRSDGAYPVRDFLWDTRPTAPVDNIVSNPPFNLAREFIDCALTIASHKVAMLLPLTFLEGQARARWLQSKPLARVHVFSWRISMPPGDLLVSGKVKATGGKKCFAWFVFSHGWQGPAQVQLLIKPVVK